jgi:phosphoglycerate dehydrogenase-like enzyme
MADVVLDLLDRRPIWAMPGWVAEEIRSALPAGWTLHEATTPSDGSGDGKRMGLAPELAKALEGARIYLGFGVTPEVLAAGSPTLQWVHTGTAGVGSSLFPELVEAVRGGRIRFTNSAGVHGPPMAETVLGMILYFFRGFDLAGAGQRESRWVSRSFYGADAPVRELAGATVGILGYGGVGREVGMRVRALGADVLGLRRSGARSAGGAGAGLEGELSALLGREEVLVGFGGAELNRLLEASDVLVITVPETSETRGLLSRDRLERLRPGVVLINVARGGVVDEGALADLLRIGRIRGAGLDVFAEEPLPESSPLWGLPNVLVTPHVSGVSRGFWRRQADLILENLGRFERGEGLRNEVRVEVGY